ncbi:tripartite tricarboxylate transporter TctB family protein [Noviherbaspirillum sp. DKR-6]|uniref:Tripartite tricarboxylate transporter TctB family protein n=2 Tax=Noviherbaspirillum pedocola TaxID=2801341 RepID=A0A934T1W6_9BURK|nr:tripartite tricarboxylate transporter TctB family protein [Noviherbaspirillum pedocola]
MLGLGLGAIYTGLGYQVGTLTRMGPGYFPVAVGAVLATMGLIIALAGLRAQSQYRRKPAAGAALPQARGQSPEWRGWSCIVLSAVAFIVLGRWGGLAPATFAVTFIAALGDRQNTIKSALLLALAMVAVAVIVFSWALQMQFPLFRWG